LSFLKEYFDDLDRKDFRRLGIVTLKILGGIKKEDEIKEEGESKDVKL